MRPPLRLIYSGQEFFLLKMAFSVALLTMSRIFPGVQDYRIFSEGIYHYIDAFKLNGTSQMLIWIDVNVALATGL